MRLWRLVEDQFWVESEYGEKFLEEAELGEERQRNLPMPETDLERKRKVGR